VREREVRIANNYCRQNKKGIEVKIEFVLLY
jgi:hypothetical protein